MADHPQKRLLYISLIGLAAIVPLAINRDYGATFSLLSIVSVGLFIRSDRQRSRPRRGFAVIPKDAQ